MRKVFQYSILSLFLSVTVAHGNPNPLQSSPFYVSPADRTEMARCKLDYYKYDSYKTAKETLFTRNLDSVPILDVLKTTNKDLPVHQDLRYFVSFYSHPKLVGKLDLQGWSAEQFSQCDKLITYFSIFAHLSKQVWGALYPDPRMGGQEETILKENMRFIFANLEDIEAHRNKLFTSIGIDPDAGEEDDVPEEDFGD